MYTHTHAHTLSHTPIKGSIVLGGAWSPRATKSSPFVHRNETCPGERNDLSGHLQSPEAVLDDTAGPRFVKEIIIACARLPQGPWSLPAELAHSCFEESVHHKNGTQRGSVRVGDMGWGCWGEEKEYRRGWLSTAATWPPRRRHCGGCWLRCWSRSSDAGCSSCSSCGGSGTISSLGVR